jgi:hypothetical protein
MSCSCCSGETHKKETFEPFIDPAPLAKRCKLDNGDKKFKMPMVGPETEGWNECPLQALPVECYQTCLQYLDIATLTTMRRVSQFTRLTIDSLHPYRELYEHAPQAIRACLSTGVASHIPLLRLHSSLTSMECYYCKTSYVFSIGKPSSKLTRYVATHPGPNSAPTSPSSNAAAPASSASETIPPSSQSIS